MSLSNRKVLYCEKGLYTVKHTLVSAVDDVAADVRHAAVFAVPVAPGFLPLPVRRNVGTDTFGVDQTDDAGKNGGASQHEPFFPEPLADRGQGAPERIQPGGFGIEVTALAGRAGIHHEIQLDILESQLRQLPE